MGELLICNLLACDILLEKAICYCIPLFLYYCCLIANLTFLYYIDVEGRVRRWVKTSVKYRCVSVLLVNTSYSN